MRAHILPLRRIGTEVGERITQFIGIVCSEIFPADAVDPLLVMTVFIGYGERQNRDPPVSELPQGGEDFPVMRIVIEVDRIQPRDVRTAVAGDDRYLLRVQIGGNSGGQGGITENESVTGNVVRSCVRVAKSSMEPVMPSR